MYIYFLSNDILSWLSQARWFGLVLLQACELVPSLAKAHAQSLSLLLLLPPQILDLLLLHLPVDLQLLVGQAHGGHTAGVSTEE